MRTKNYKSLTKEEKALVKAMVNLYHSNGWEKPEEYYVTKVLDKWYIESRNAVEEMIDAEWEKLLDKGCK